MNEENRKVIIVEAGNNFYHYTVDYYKIEDGFYIFSHMLPHTGKKISRKIDSKYVMEILDFQDFEALAENERINNEKRAEEIRKLQEEQAKKNKIVKPKQ